MFESTDIDPEVLVKYMKLRAERRLGRIWIHTDGPHVTVAPVDAPPLYERRHATVMTDSQFVQLVEKEWLNRPLELFK